MSKIYLVEVKYRGSKSSRSYSYYSDLMYNKDDLVVVPVAGREKHAIVVNCFEAKKVIRSGE